MYECESWTLRRLSTEELMLLNCWCWRRLLIVPWTARRSNQSILKEISPGYSLEGLMLRLKLQSSGHLMQRADSLEKDPHAGQDWGQEKGADRGWDGWMASPTEWTWFEQNLGVGDGQGGLACCDSWGRKELDPTERLNWIDQAPNASGPSCGWLIFMRLEGAFLSSF